MAHKTKLTIRGFHCDAYGHVNNARYAELFEEARWQCLEQQELSSTLAERDLQFFIVEINIVFKRGLVPNQQVEIITSTEEVKERNIVFKQEIIDCKTGKTSTIAHVNFILFSKELGKTITIDSQIEDIFRSI